MANTIQDGTAVSSGHSYKTLGVGKRLLKNFGDLATASDEGITQADLTDCETWAYHEINAVMARHGYDVSGWESDPPPMVAHLADELASARAWMFKFMREGAAAPGMFTDVVNTSGDRIEHLAVSGLLDSDGGRVAGDSPSVLRVASPGRRS